MSVTSVGDRAPRAVEERRVPASAPPVTEHALLALQRSAGNQAVSRYLAARSVARSPPDGGVQGSGGGVPAPATSGGGGAAPGSDGSGGGSPPVPAPAPAAGPAESPDPLPLSGEARIRLNNPMTFPLGGGDLSELNLGKGKLATPSIPLFGTGIEAAVEVGAHNPMRMQGQHAEISPVVVKIDAKQIEQRRTERESQAHDSTAAKAAAAAGGIWGGLSPLGWAMGGPGEAGKRAGNAAASAVESRIEQQFRAELEEATVKAGFGLVYNPYVTLRLGVEGMSKFFEAVLTLQMSWALKLAPFLSLGKPGATAKGTGVELFFTNGRLSRAAFNLAITGGLEVDLDTKGMLTGSVSIMRVLDDDEKKRDPGLINVPLFNTEVFDLLKAHLVFAATANLELATGSAIKVRGEHLTAKSSAKSCEDALMDLLKSKAVGERVKKNVTRERDPDEPTDWHAGTEADPIPIDYYKPLEFYRHEITAYNRDGSIRIPQWPHQVYEELAEDPGDLGLRDDEVAEKGWAVGVGNPNVPQKGRPLVRTTPGSRAQADKWKLTAKRFKVDLNGFEVDHVIDLGLGGKDEAQNLWPIKEADNRAAALRMYEEQMVPAPWVPKGTPSKTNVKSLPPGTVLKIRALKKP